MSSLKENLESAQTCLCNARDLVGGISDESARRRIAEHLDEQIEKIGSVRYEMAELVAALDGPSGAKLPKAEHSRQPLSRTHAVGLAMVIVKADNLAVSARRKGNDDAEAHWLEVSAEAQGAIERRTVAPTRFVELLDKCEEAARRQTGIENGNHEGIAEPSAGVER